MHSLAVDLYKCVDVAHCYRGILWTTAMPESTHPRRVVLPSFRESFGGECRRNGPQLIALIIAPLDPFDVSPDPKMEGNNPAPIQVNAHPQSRTRTEVSVLRC